MNNEDDHAHNNLSAMDEEELRVQIRSIIKDEVCKLNDAQATTKENSSVVISVLDRVLAAVSNSVNQISTISFAVGEISRKVETPIQNQNSIRSVLDQFAISLSDVQLKMATLNALLEQTNKSIIAYFIANMQTNAHNNSGPSTIIENNTDNKIK